MIERVIENWLDRASERTFQKPFCYMLSNQGHTIVHLSRHCGMEMGKDVISLDHNGTPCAFQLKAAPNGKITLSKWRNEIMQQTFELVTTKIDHPSIKTEQEHKSFLVTNGDIDEEVCRAIQDRNRSMQNRGDPHRELNVITGGNLKSWAKELQEGLWPIELANTKAFLELFLMDGDEIYPKHKLAQLLESVMPFDNDMNGRAPSKEKCYRAAASSALLTSMTLSQFSRRENFVAEIEAWTIYLAYLLALAERRALPERKCKSELSIAISCIEEALERLCVELMERTDYIEGNNLYPDDSCHRIRMTWLLGLMGIYGLWRRERATQSELDDFLREFCINNHDRIILWGEGAVPLHLALYWYLRTCDSSLRPDVLIKKLILSICTFKETNENKPLPNPYYGANEVLSNIYGMIDNTIEEDFTGQSYTLEGLLHIFVRRNWKQQVKSIWPDYTRFAHCSFNPNSKWQLYKWKNDEGINIIRMQKHNQNWNDLKSLAEESNGTNIPNLLKHFPILTLLFICVYPHRLSSEITRWLDAQMGNLI